MNKSKTVVVCGRGILFLLLLAFAFVSCKKEDADTMKDVNFEGQYVGMGTDKDDNPFLKGHVKIEKISSNRIRVKGLGSTPITTFEVSVQYLASQVVTVVEETTAVEINLSTTPYQLSFEGLNNETFTGNKN